jgi:hypothetical protein
VQMSFVSSRYHRRGSLDIISVDERAVSLESVATTVVLCLWRRAFIIEGFSNYSAKPSLNLVFVVHVLPSRIALLRDMGLASSRNPRMASRMGG